MAVTRYGVRLSPRKARLFDAVARAGDVGVPMATLIEVLYQGTARASTVRAHVNQLNVLMAGTGVWISGNIVRGVYLMRVPKGVARETFPAAVAGGKRRA